MEYVTAHLLIMIDIPLSAVYFVLFAVWGASYFIGEKDYLSLTIKDCFIFICIFSTVIPIPVNLVITATSIVYIGCHRSINLLRRCNCGCVY